MDRGEHNEGNNRCIIVIDATIKQRINTHQIDRKIRYCGKHPNWREKRQKAHIAKEICQVVDAIERNESEDKQPGVKENIDNGLSRRATKSHIAIPEVITLIAREEMFDSREG